MPNYTVDALRTVRSIQAAHARAGHTAQAEQMRRIGDQVAGMIEALRVTAGNIRSLGPAGSLGPSYEAYSPWLEIVEQALGRIDA